MGNMLGWLNNNSHIALTPVVIDDYKDTIRACMLQHPNRHSLQLHSACTANHSKSLVLEYTH